MLACGAAEKKRLDFHFYEESREGRSGVGGGGRGVLLDQCHHASGMPKSVSTRLHLRSLSLSHTRTHTQVAHLDLIKHGVAHYQHTFLRNYFSPVSRQDIFLTLDKPISVFFLSFFSFSLFFSPSHSTDRQPAGRSACRDPNITFSKLNLELNELLKQP